MRVTPPSALAVLLRYNVISDRHPCRSFAHRQLETPPSHPRSLGVAVFCPLCHRGRPPPVPETDEEGRGGDMCSFASHCAAGALPPPLKLSFGRMNRTDSILSKKLQVHRPLSLLPVAWWVRHLPAPRRGQLRGLAAGRIVRGKRDGNHRSRIRGPPGQLDRVSMACS